ncbi:MAG TPA: biotin--[acetyl-CoA-carboxylase] ligase [candidate division Zixibacteria bacterium]|nr:biotin--[acetyl-CoA-carboxylase] ligase [candidate division Zixibacteria bacterium]
MSAEIALEKFQESLYTKRFGRRVFFSREVNSTSEWAKNLAKMGAGEGTVAVAETQTAGRGRLGREWASPRGGLWFSIVLRPKLEASEAAKLVFVASLAVAEALHEKYGLRTETKWPNDVLVQGKKICGVLAEMNTKGETINYVVLGIGVNANFANDALPEFVKTNATSIEKEFGKKIRLESLLKALLEKMETIYDRYLEAGFSPLLEQWKTYAGFLGRKVVITDQEERLNGLALDVDLDGALILKLEDGTRRRIRVGDLVFPKL